MSQTGYTPILIYSSTTASQAPSAGNLTNSTLGSELAINITDGKLFYKDNANAVQVIGWKTTPTTAGGTGLTSYAAGDLIYYATGTTLSKLAIGSNTNVLTSSGTAPQWTAQSSLSVGTASNLLSNSTTGVMQITGPAAASTRVMTIPDANFTAARTDAAQTFTGNQTFATQSITANASAVNFSTSATGQLFSGGTDATKYTGTVYRGANSWNTFVGRIPDAVGDNWAIGNDYTGAYGSLLIFGANDITVSRGNLIQGTAAKGINFTANSAAAGMTSQLLNWYEEGTWTPTIVAGSGSYTTVTVNNASYTRTGRQVFLMLSFIINSKGTGSAGAKVTGLPFTPNSTGLTRFAGSGVDNSTGVMLLPYIASTTMYVVKYDGGDLSASNNLTLNITYYV